MPRTGAGDADSAPGTALASGSVGLLVALEASGPSFVDELRRSWDRGDAVLPVDPRLPDPAVRELLAIMRVGEAADGGDALVMATSGTTGRPKGVVLTHDAIAASARVTSRHLGIEADRHVWLACLPLAHVGGLSVVMRAWHSGAGLVVHDGFDAPAVDDAARAGATHVSLVATALRRIDVAQWDRIVLGGSAPPRDRPDNVVTTYGMTETGSGVVYDGVPLDDVEVRAVDGELWIRGPMVAERYRDGTPVTDEDGWLHTGDAGTVSPAGTVAVQGRRGDMIITGGENVFPDPVEARLRDHPRVADAAVVGRDDPEWGQRVVAVIEPTTQDVPTLDELRDWVKQTLPAHAAPKELEVRSLPRTALGKVKRHELR